MKSKIALLLFFALTAFTLLQNRKITGVVTDEYQKPLAGVMVSVPNTMISTTTDSLGRYTIQVPAYALKLTFVLPHLTTQQIDIGKSNTINVTLKTGRINLTEALADHQTVHRKVSGSYVKMESAPQTFMAPMQRYQPGETENYNPINENGFQVASQMPVTTFSVDVDRAAYSNTRRFLNNGQMPPVDAVRIEEMINYFDYDYAGPSGEHPIAVSTEMTDSPWNPGLKLLHIGLQAKTVPTKNLPASNLVFLIDVSGSMSDQNKLPLLKQAFKLLVDQLRPQDKISIVVYAGAAGEILKPTSGSEKMTIKEALDGLEAGGSTAGGAGIELAYKLAKDNFIKNGNNRVILATDGDFNVGISSEGALQRLIEEKRKEGIFLSIMGFGMGNYKDSHIETLADKGNGNYAYIDNIQEARKEFVQEFGGTLFTIAKDVKIQIEFNPRHVQAYRLIGYENRALKNEEFHDDKKDAGEMGSGHTVTALYEIVPTGAKSPYLSKNDALKYQKTDASDIGKTDEMLTLKIRYKKPDEDQSVLFDMPVKNISRPMAACSENLRFASAVAEFGLLLRGSEFKGKASYRDVIARAKTAFGKDEEGYRSEFVQLVKTAETLDNRKETAQKD
ncbi:von Willebrand factor type A domain-containing protein [Dyadobacter chenwenxiniae]|uniref:von Willebrand factor type A domain-containing protein n=1 Tax=Dyadobacter chenwenxiniae TaxID=2906456 RepID=A0A9X1PMU9_9BACT|nr:von Willebrand factor type A domain-containing protein [Dyadobacter chenwenxiniae]MCF0062478.1 von Willebrand factor type A domain-containing protein [Dyadobacter chenwenxiniae]UON83774.1 von Willebrand factor type A domain-containing protein [Dyadobacter chenwenxiniae]